MTHFEKSATAQSSRLTSNPQKSEKCLSYLILLTKNEISDEIRAVSRAWRWPSIGEKRELPRCRLSSRKSENLTIRGVGADASASRPVPSGMPRGPRCLHREALRSRFSRLSSSARLTGMPRGRAAACRACSSRILAHLGRTADVTTLRSRGGASSPARTRPSSHSLIASRMLPHMTSAARPFTRHAAAVVRAQGSAWTRASTSSGPSTCARRPAGATRAKCSSASADADHFFDL